MLIAGLIATLIVTTAQDAAAKASPKLARFTATAAFADGGTRVFHVSTDRDSDNDGVSDLYELRVTCRDGAVASATIAPRDAASGLATGKRQHAPVTRANPQPVDDWQTRAVGGQIAASWNLATAKGARSMAPSTPQPVTLVEVAPAVCAP